MPSTLSNPELARLIPPSPVLIARTRRFKQSEASYHARYGHSVRERFVAGLGGGSAASLFTVIEEKSSR